MAHLLTADWSCDVDAERHVSWMRMSGTVTVLDVIEAQKSLAAHPRFNPLFPLVVDLRGTCDLPLTRAQVRRIIAESPVALSSPRVIVAESILTAAVAHAYRALRADLTHTHVVRICRAQEARDWLRATQFGRSEIAAIVPVPDLFIPNG
jgi:hypothetical protein